MKYCVEITPTFLSAVFATLSISALSYALYQFWYTTESNKSFGKSDEETDSIAPTPRAPTPRELKIQRTMSEDSVEIPPKFLHFHKLVGALNAELLPNWCQQLCISWNDVIMDILEWMYKEKHPNLYDFETCMSIILYKNEENSDDVDNQDETHETRNDKDEIDDETYVQASIWINVALQLWDTEPSLVMPHAWFVISQHNEEIESDDATEETEQPSEEQPDEDEKSKEPLNNKSQE